MAWPGIPKRAPRGPGERTAAPRQILAGATFPLVRLVSCQIPSMARTAPDSEGRREAGSAARVVVGEIASALTSAEARMEVNLID